MQSSSHVVYYVRRFQKPPVQWHACLCLFERKQKTVTKKSMSISLDKTPHLTGFLISSGDHAQGTFQALIEHLER